MTPYAFLASSPRGRAAQVPVLVVVAVAWTPADNLYKRWPARPLGRAVTFGVFTAATTHAESLVDVGGTSPLHGDLLTVPSRRAPGKTEARGARWCHERLVRCPTEESWD